MVSIIIPTFNELSRHNYLQKIINELKAHAHIELLVVDSGSSDGTLEFVKKNKVTVFSCSGVTRAERLNIGLEKANHDLVILHHPRSFLKLEAINNLLKQKEDIVWGGFSHSFDKKHWLLKFTSWYSNNVRSRRGVLYLDHCLFLNRSKIKESVSIPPVEIFEDSLLSYKLRTYGKPVVLKEKAVTSAIRFESKGLYKQALMNQFLKLAFLMKKSDKKMNQLYEQNLNLNNKVKDKTNF